MRVRAIRLDSEGRDLAFGRRNVQGPEHPVPQREAASQILVEMRRIARVVNLMMGRAHEQPAQPSGKCNPDLRMLQVNINIDEEHEDDVVLREPVLMSGPAQEVLADAACEPGEDREDVEEDAHIHRMDAEVRHRRQHRRRMVNLVEFPEERNPVAEIMIEPVAELVGQEQHHGDDRPRHERRQRRRRHRTKQCGELIDDGAAQHLVGKQRPPEHDAEHEDVEVEIAEIGQGRPAQHDAPGEQRPDQCSRVDAPAFPIAPGGDDGAGDEQRAGQRGERDMRTGRQQRLAEPVEKIRKDCRQIQARLRSCEKLRC